MAAETASRRDCAGCGAPLQGALAPHLCAGCGRPQPVSAGEDYFQALGAPRSFAQDASALERRFYELSRALHPDRFSAADPGSRRLSLERMSLVNRAYATLKDPRERRAYLLALEGVQAPSSRARQLPAELAESWFELQDAMAEDPAAARSRVPEFLAALRRGIEARERDLSLLERQYDEKPSREALERIAEAIQAESYLRSLERDVGGKLAS